jgi:hypothetical protein
MSSPDKNPEQSESELREIAAHPATHGVELEDWHSWWKTSGAQELRKLLMTYWDPIGVNGIPEAADEYDSYLGPLAKKLREGADARGVSEYLSEIQRKRMEIPARDDQLAYVSERVANWYAVETRTSV